MMELKIVLRKPADLIPDTTKPLSSAPCTDASCCFSLWYAPEPWPVDGSILFIRKIRIVGKCSQSLEFTIVEAGIPSRVFYNCISYIERLLETITFILGLPSWYAATAAAAKSPQLCPTLCDPTDQAPLSLGFSRQEYWSGLPFPSPMHESESEVTQSCLTLSDPMDCLVV